MGFPTWTLIGMGVTFIIAFFMIILAYLALSPGTARKIGLGGARLGLRLKTFTGVALAMMLLFMGFFLAGVPLEPLLSEMAVPSATPVTNVVIPPTTAVTATTLFTATIATTPLTSSAPLTATDSSTPSSGAFAGPPPEEEADSDLVNAVTEATATETPTFTVTPVTFTPTSTPTPLPTATATPTMTPTPIDEETAVLDLGGSVLWLRRSPGGQTVMILQDEEVVILRGGYGNWAGILWREVSTGSGITGWVEEQFLLYAAEE